MWISRKTSRLREKQTKLEPLHFIVTGGSNIGKSTLIRFALQNLIQKQDKLQGFQYHQTTIELNKMKHIINVIEYNNDNQLTIPVHGSLVCYDLTNKNSLDCIPDLLNIYLSQNIPTYLVGLKADLTYQIDPIVENIIQLYNLPHFVVDAFSDRGIQQMKDVFKSLLTEHFPNLKGFVYAPTAKITMENTRSEDSIDPDNSYFFPTYSRRESKDSCESIGGLSIEDIIDRVLSIEYNKADENLIPIFLTFYRRFLTPNELVERLIERFKMNELSYPSSLQKRIHTIFTAWLSHYWNDFSSPQTRQHMILFIDEIAHYEHYTPMCDALAPLVIREPPLDDPDESWGLSDHVKKKTDSGYASGYFYLSNSEPPIVSTHLRWLQNYNRVVSHAESQPNLNMRTELPRRTEFAGGLINIDNAARHPIESNWAASLGHHASSFISSLRQTEKEDNYKLLMKTSEKIIADQLTWVESELFSRLHPREFLRNMWRTKGSNTVMASTAHFNFISAWVVTAIVTQSRLNKRVVLLEKFMSIAVALRDLNNYNSMMAILAGINNASVLRLKQTRQIVETKKIYKRFQSLERLMSSDRSFSSYRLALKTSGTPGIPYLGIHNQDLVSLVEANKDFKADGIVHWEKFRLMGETIMATMKFKYPGYTIEPDFKILTCIADSRLLSEDEQYKKSIMIEPRLTTSSTSKLRSLWFRI